MSLTEPADIRAATVHPNPYPFYARLVVERPIYREGSTGPWVMTSAANVRAVLTNEFCATRPPGAVVPDIMAGSPTAAIYTRMVRINHGKAHCPIKNNVVGTLDAVQIDTFAESSGRLARVLAARLEPESDRARLTQFIYALPVEVLTPLVGVASDRVADVGRWIGAFGGASSAAVTSVPAATSELIAHGAEASRQLLAFFHELADGVKAGDRHLLAKMLRDAEAAGAPDRETTIANAIGVLAQGFAATSALIGASLLALARHDGVREAVMKDRRLVAELVREVARCDTVTQSLPRFVTDNTEVAGQSMRAGDMIIVSLAAANRDPALNIDPNRFDLHRKNRRYLEFGAGAHACAGVQIACLLAEIAIELLLERKIALAGITEHVSWRPSAHVRMAVFGN
jgi:cytochrome P450